LRQRKEALTQTGQGFTSASVRRARRYAAKLGAQPHPKGAGIRAIRMIVARRAADGERCQVEPP